MHSEGYTLIELLIVMTIMAMVGLVGYVNYKQFSASQITTNAVTQIQSILRLAQSNATSSVLCNDNPASVSPWSLSFNANQTSITLACGPSNSPWKTYNLENAKIDNSIAGSTCISPATLPFTISYSNTSVLTFSSAGSTATCLQSASWIFTVRNINDNSTKSFSISKGGAVNVQ